MRSEFQNDNLCPKVTNIVIMWRAGIREGDLWFGSHLFWCHLAAAYKTQQFKALKKAAVRTAKAQRTPRWNKQGVHPKGEPCVREFLLNDLAILAPWRFKCSFQDYWSLRRELEA